MAPLTEFDGHRLPYREATPELLVREPPPSGVGQEPHEVLVQRVCEVVPDVLPAHVFKLLNKHKAAASQGNLLDVVVQTLLEGPYPKDFKGGGKARAATSDTPKNVDTSIDYAKPDINRMQGPVYQGLCLVCLYVSPRHACCLLTWGAGIPP